MENRKRIRLSDYDYTLPDERIAKYPVSPRDASKLLVYDGKDIVENTFSQIHQYLHADDLLVFNDTRVIPARLTFLKPTGANIEIFLLNPYNPNSYTSSFTSQHECVWKCLVGNKRKWKDETLSVKGDHNLTATWVDREENLVRFNWNRDSSFAMVLETYGKTPIPPYLNREMEASDREQYQTVYARYRGSVAAPTAGLHVTPRVMQSLKNKSIRQAFVTLHVGAGTFQPVQSENVLDHTMHAELFEVDIQLINRLINYGDKTIAVGTTTVRTLESLYWLGIKIKNNVMEHEPFVIEQWDYMNLPGTSTFIESMQVIKDWMLHQERNQIRVSTQIMIVPGYTFRAIKAMVTNFHQPKSTLLMLIAAAVGNDWTRIYDYALQHDFRFLSYGDSSLLFLER